METAVAKPKGSGVRGQGAAKNGQPLPFWTALLADLPGIAERNTLKGALHLASLRTVSDVVALDKDKDLVLAALSRRNLTSFDAVTIIQAIDERWTHSVSGEMGPAPWGSKAAGEPPDRPAKAPGKPSAMCCGTHYSAKDGSLTRWTNCRTCGKALVWSDGVPGGGVTEAASVDRVAKAKSRRRGRRCSSPSSACRWLTKHGFDAGGETVQVLDAIARAAGTTQDQPAKASTPATEETPHDAAPAAAVAPSDGRARTCCGIDYGNQPGRVKCMACGKKLKPPAAPVDRAAPAEPVELQVRVGKIIPSVVNPRKTFDEAKLQELAESIRQRGILQPLVVRPTYQLDKQGIGQGAYVEKHAFWTDAMFISESGLRGPAAWPEMVYELIAGERRFRAAKLAGLDQVPVRVIDIDDRGVLEVMVIENEQRDDVAPLEKADGYAALLEHGHTVESLAAKVGKSTATIYGLLKLRDLPAAARKAVAAGTLPATTAQLIGRIPNEKLRAQAAQDILAGPRFSYRDDDESPMSFRDAKALIEHEYMRELKAAPFSRERVNLVPGVGACTACPKCTGNNRAEFPDGRADICTDPACYDQKVEAHAAAQVASYREQGVEVLDEAPPYGKVVRLEEKCWEDGKHRTYDKLLAKAIAGGAVPLQVFVDERTGKVHKVAPRQAAERWLKEQGILKRTSEASSHTRGLKAQREADKLRTGAARLAVAAIVARLETGLVEADARELRALVLATWGEIWHESKKAVLKRRGVEPQGKDKFGPSEGMEKAFRGLVESLAAPQLVGLWGELVCTKALVGSHYEGDSGKRNRKELCEAFGLDWKKLQAEAKSPPAASPQAASQGGPTYEELAAATVAMKLSGTIKQTPSTRPVELDGQKWVVAGGVSQNGTYTARCLPLHPIEEFRKLHKSAGRKAPVFTDATREAGTCYFGVHLQVQGKLHAIGKGEREVTVTIPKGK